MKIILSLGLLCFWGLSVAAHAGSQVDIRDGYVRLPVPGQTRAAAFMQIRNRTGQKQVLESVHCSCASKVEIHSHRHEDGVMKMRREETLAIGAGETVSLEPGGWHFMLFDWDPAIRTGQQVELQLHFSDQSTQFVSLPVKSVFDGGEHRHQH